MEDEKKIPPNTLRAIDLRKAIKNRFAFGWNATAKLTHDSMHAALEAGDVSLLRNSDGSEVVSTVPAWNALAPAQPVRPAPVAQPIDPPIADTLEPIAETPAPTPPVPIAPIARPAAPAPMSGLEALLAEAVKPYLTTPSIDETKVEQIARNVLNDARGEWLRIATDIAARSATQAIEAIGLTRIEIKRFDGTRTVINGQHEEFPRLIRLLSLRLNVFLKGPAGSGKTTAAEKAAEALGLPCYIEALGPQTTQSGLLGYMDAHGNYVQGKAYAPFKHGGVLALDEIDAAASGILVVINSLLANGSYRFPNGEVVTRHADFVVVAAGNTFGRGADALYVGRNQLDAATLDRFLILVWDYDEALEARLVDAEAGAATGAARDWLQELRTYRQRAADKKLRVVISQRKAIAGARMLGNGFERDEVRQLVLWNHVSTDDRAKLEAA